MTEEKLDRIPYPSTMKAAFYEKHHHLTDSEVQKELLYYTQLKLEKLERIRRNTSMIITWLIVLPVVLGVVLFIAGAMS